ncbi:hypothetical protein EMPS_05691 [Entomortierella parvispora]|uniref:Major facilitator superfamily (MFS) profile domain-containing protein n=1 Tax=Entomortierella parvispora TaxID=205924 RepID=A0A9P3HBA2_9FUNG|nr:hypothetical protein EMPS_05691 [Entomortierella parvispora]
MADTQPSTSPSSRILDRRLWSRREYTWMLAGVLTQAVIYSFEVNLMYACVGAITAIFEVTSLASILPTILQILSAALVPFYTKISDVVGRAQALTVAMIFYLIGYTIQGTSKVFLQFALGQIFYGIGSTGMQTLTQVLIADTTSLANRGIVFALYDLPSIVSVFVTTRLADPLTDVKSHPNANWRNVYIIVGILAAVGAVAILSPLWYLQKKGQKKVKVERRSVKWLLHEFDAVGAILITLGLSLTLLPMILAKTFEGNWKNYKILTMFCCGIVFLGLLVFWEIKYTDRPIMSMKIWSNPSCFGALIVMFFMTVQASMNWQYYTQYLVVSRDLSFGDALMLERGYNVGYLVFQLITALLMKRFNTLRPFIWAGIIVHTGGIGLMIRARAPTASSAFVVISQTIVGAAGGMANIASSVLVTGVVDKKDIATVIGTTQILGSFGSALGDALAGGIWTQYLPVRLAKRVTGPYDEYLAMNSPLVYIPSLDPVTKAQVVTAYSDSQRLMSIIACCLAVFCCLSTIGIKRVDLYKDDKDLIEETIESETIEEKSVQVFDEEKAHATEVK